MDEVSGTTKTAPWKRRLICVDEGIYKYQDKDATEKFLARIKHKGEDYRKFGFPTVTKARQWRQSRIGAIADNRFFPERKVGQGLIHHTLFKDYAIRWLHSCRTKNLKRTTIRSYQGIVKTHLIPAFRKLSLSSIERAQVREMIIGPRALSLEPKTMFSQANEELSPIIRPQSHRSSCVRNNSATILKCSTMTKKSSSSRRPKSIGHTTILLCWPCFGLDSARERRLR